MKAHWLVPGWPAPVTVRALSTWRSGGASAAPYASLNLGDHVGDAPASVAENRRRLAAAASLPAEPEWLAQVHGTRVADLDAEGRGTEGRGAAGRGAAGADGLKEPADAAFSRHPKRVCAILTADCLPILLAADSGDLVAAIHAGWRGLAAGIIETTLAALGVPPAKLLAWLGPAIGPRHFEVGEEVRAALLERDPKAGAAFVPNARGRFMADLSGLARRRLTGAGIARIYGGEYCTFTEADKYFSHRRDGVTGRQATLIWLEDARGPGKALGKG